MNLQHLLDWLKGFLFLWFIFLIIADCAELCIRGNAWYGDGYLGILMALFALVGIF